jgi:HAD domain in Swiss Army Knife RNA repair proteins
MANSIPPSVSEPRPGSSTIFLDIDGVVLTGNAWALPANKAAVELMQNRQSTEALEIVSFDTEAVRLVVRLAERTDSQIVISSNWRKTVGWEFARRKLIEQGISERLFHADCYTLIIGFRESNKASEIVAWLDEHRLAPATEQPDQPSLLKYGKQTAELRAKHEADLKKYHADYAAWQRSVSNDHGINYVILEDEGYGFRHLRVIDTLFDTGFTASEYTIALRSLGGTDPEMGVDPIGEADWTRILAAWNNDSHAAARWLHRPCCEDAPLAPVSALFGDEDARTWFWEQLSADTLPIEDFIQLQKG